MGTRFKNKKEVMYYELPGMQNRNDEAIYG